MDVKASKRFTDQRERSFFNPINGQAGGGVGGGWPTNKVVCVYVLEGRCNRNPCRFAHTESSSLLLSNPKLAKKSPPSYNRLKNNLWVSSGSEDRIPHVRNRENPGYTGPKNSSSASSTVSDESGDKSTSKKTTLKNVCCHWLLGNCVRGDECRFLHSWFCGEGLTMLAKLEGHEKAVSGIALPLRSDKLFSGSRDGTAWNIESSAEFSLDGPVGEVYSMVVANEMLFAGAQDGHTRPVTCLAVGRSRLCSGSMDNTIRVWELDTLEPVMTLNDHTDAPMSLLCWDQFLLSCSLDHTIKVWFATGRGNLEAAYTHKEDNGVLALGGLNDPDGKPVLICACNDNTVHLYELPSFMERGRIFSKHEVRVIEIGPDKLFFTGDGAGMLGVWKLLAKPS
ncbi:hypothetical protein CISIN_1g016134mg [Citrus sinensis]|uniref:C3H1-type domain-containing protein n=1 Tax=Citrus sinensis TaxID=2711 RepID=A0A067E5U7_CITSI|nr:hypothetical protein CISIN_1g016134mg [Citrus sinensis]